MPAFNEFSRIYLLYISLCKEASLDLTSMTCIWSDHLVLRVYVFGCHRHKLFHIHFQQHWQVAFTRIGNLTSIVQVVYSSWLVDRIQNTFKYWKKTAQLLPMLPVFIQRSSSCSKIISIKCIINVISFRYDS